MLGLRPHFNKVWLNRDEDSLWKSMNGWHRLPKQVHESWGSIAWPDFLPNFHSRHLASLRGKDLWVYVFILPLVRNFSFLKMNMAGPGLAFCLWSSCCCLISSSATNSPSWAGEVTGTQQGALLKRCVRQYEIDVGCPENDIFISNPLMISMAQCTRIITFLTYLAINMDYELHQPLISANT